MRARDELADFQKWNADMKLRIWRDMYVRLGWMSREEVEKLSMEDLYLLADAIHEQIKETT